MRDERFLTAAHLDMLVVAASPEALLERLLRARPTHVPNPFEPVRPPPGG